MCKVCVEDWPITTVLKLKLVAEREITGPLGEEERGVTLAQPTTANAISRSDAAEATLRLDRLLEKRDDTSVANLLRFGNSKLPSEEEQPQPVQGTVVGQGLHSVDLY
jgi:hypothetical protein